MNPETIHNCLTLGWSSRYNNRDGIGRFGVGMTLGAIHECKRIEVWSRPEDGDWNFTYMDLEEIESGSLSSVPPPTIQRLPKEFIGLAGKNKGTIIIWRKYDRQSADGHTMIADFEKWCGRTFRYFIWGEPEYQRSAVTIRINDHEVRAIDPLYVRLKKTRFPNDPVAEEFAPMSLTWPLDTNAPGFSDGQRSTVRIRMSLLPEEWRQNQGDGSSSVANERHIPDNEGISILRGCNLPSAPTGAGAAPLPGRQA